jgi:hypothetical protein
MINLPIFSHMGPFCPYSAGIGMNPIAISHLGLFMPYFAPFGIGLFYTYLANIRLPIFCRNWHESYSNLPSGFIYALFRTVSFANILGILPVLRLLLWLWMLIMKHLFTVVLVILLYPLPPSMSGNEMCTSPTYMKTIFITRKS